jgi:hypothetical protein
MGSFCYHKSANFLGVPVRKSQIRIFLQNYAQHRLKTFIKVVVSNSFLFFYKSELEHLWYMLKSIVVRRKVCKWGLVEVLNLQKSLGLQHIEKFANYKSLNHKKD